MSGLQNKNKKITRRDFVNRTGTLIGFRCDRPAIKLLTFCWQYETFIEHPDQGC